MLIYLIDDDAVSLFLTDQILRLGGVRGAVLTFENSEKALRHLLAGLAAEEHPQLIFLDLNMPVVDGWDFLDALAPHAAQLRHRCAIYLLTSSLALADTSKARLYPLVQGVIHKPLNAEHIADVMARHAALG